jgi:hypothetical protein
MEAISTTAPSTSGPESAQAPSMLFDGPPAPADMRECGTWWFGLTLQEKQNYIRDRSSLTVSSSPRS